MKIGFIRINSIIRVIFVESRAENLFVMIKVYLIDYLLNYALLLSRKKLFKGHYSIYFFKEDFSILFKVPPIFFFLQKAVNKTTQSMIFT